MSYNPNNAATGEIGESRTNHTFTSHGYTVKSHDIYDGGCDGIFSINGVIIGCYEVNYWQPNTYFVNERIFSIDSNLYNGLEYENEKYVNHRHTIKYRFHFCFGVKRNKAQKSEAMKLGIIYIHTKTLPTSDKLWALIAPFLRGNPFTKFYKVNCIGNTHLKNDRTSMEVLLTPIINNIITSIQDLTSKIAIFRIKVKLKRSLLELKSSVKDRFSKSYSVVSSYSNTAYLQRSK